MLYCLFNCCFLIINCWLYFCLCITCFPLFSLFFKIANNELNYCESTKYISFFLWAFKYLVHKFYVSTIAIFRPTLFLFRNVNVGKVPFIFDYDHVSTYLVFKWLQYIAKNFWSHLWRSYNGFAVFLIREQPLYLHEVGGKVWVHANLVDYT